LRLTCSRLRLTCSRLRGDLVAKDDLNDRPWHAPSVAEPRSAGTRCRARYVATHICDSVKRRLKADGTSGLQGEFGIGLLSFWTVGDELSITSTGDDRRAYQMVMRKGDPTYRHHHRLVSDQPTKGDRRAGRKQH